MTRNISKMTKHPDAKILIHTERGQNWLAQFDIRDRELAGKVAKSLILISHNEFERNLINLIEENAKYISGTIALYSIREIDPSISFFVQASADGESTVNALSAGADHGSEARIAAIIRNLCKQQEKFLNHPSVDKMRQNKCRSIFFIDDFIGSGERVRAFIKSFRLDKTISSWCSLKYIDFRVLSYSGTEKGIRFVQRHKPFPAVRIHKGCPSFHDMPWRKNLRIAVYNLCKRYGEKTSKGWWWDGYGQAMASMVFEHGCPDNAPVILWAPDDKHKPWFPLFNDRTIGSTEQSVFPPEIVRGDAKATLIDVGQKKLAQSGALSRRGLQGQNILLILALISKGHYRQIALSYATGLSEEDCCRILELCIRWGYITNSKRITKRGAAEINAAKEVKNFPSRKIDLGSDNYYPYQLRETAYD